MVQKEKAAQENNLRQPLFVTFQFCQRLTRYSLI